MCVLFIDLVIFLNSVELIYVLNVCVKIINNINVIKFEMCEVRKFILFNILDLKRKLVFLKCVVFYCF